MDSLLKKATTNDDNPTPGYVYTELAKLTHADVTTCDKMADWLFDKLKKNDSAIKWKTLLVMKHVAKGGRMDFRRSLQKRNDEVKAALQFKGPPDPLRGDEPYRRVRDAAKEALEAMFDNTPPPSVSSSAMSGRITGMSSGANDPRFPPAPTNNNSNSGYPPIPQVRPSGGFSTALPGQPGYDPNSPMHAPPVSTGSMSGFGNYDPKKDSGGGILGAVKSAFTTSVATVPPATARPQQTSNGYPPATQPRPQSNFPPAEYRGTPSTTANNAGGYGGPSQFGAPTGNHRPGQPGGGWGSTSSSLPTNTNPSQGGLGRRGHMPAGTSGEPGRVGGAAKDGKFERTLVEDLTAPGGVRAVPDKDKLSSFITSVRTLDMTIIGPLLDERLSLAFPESTDPSGVAIATKALLVIEAIANSSVEGIEPVRKYLADHCDILLDLLENAEVKGSVRSITHRVLKALGVQVDEPAGLAPAPAPSQVFTYTSPEPAPAPVPVPTSNPVQPTTTAVPDLLGLDFLSTPAPAPTPAVVPTTNLFSGLSAVNPTPAVTSFVAPTPAPAPAVSGFSDLFGGLSLGSTPATTTAPATVPTTFPVQATVQPVVQQQQQPMQQPQPVQPVVQQQQATPNPGANAAALQQQLMTIQQQISMITMQISSNPAAASALMPQLMALQQQQTQLIMASTQQQAMQPQQPQGFGAMQPMGGFGMQPQSGFGGMQPMGGFNAMQPMGGFGGMQQQPQQGFGGMGMMNPGTLGGMSMGPRPTVTPAPVPAPAPAPRPTDAFDFASAGLFG